MALRRKKPVLSQKGEPRFVLTLLSFQYSKNIEVLLEIGINLEKGEGYGCNIRS